MRITNHVEKIKINDVEKKMEIRSIGKHIVWSHLVHGTSQIKSLGAPVCYVCSCASWRLSEPASKRPTSAFSAGKPGSRRTNNFPRGLTLSKFRLRAKPTRIRNEHGSWNFVAAWFQSADNSSSVELHKAARLADGAMQLLIDATLRPLEAKVERKEECLILKSHDIWCSPCI